MNVLIHRTKHHRDPFDRILIAQSLEEKLPIVTSDPWFDRYPVRVIW
jgi:PIN domain nuclease of toxin-antitoxin system